MAAGLSLRGLADVTGIAESTLSQIISGNRVAKMPEIMMIAEATGCTIPQVTGTEMVADRVQCSLRATNGFAVESLREGLLGFLELNDYLEGQAVPATT